jgi:hypothetical protein
MTPEKESPRRDGTGEGQRDGYEARQNISGGDPDAKDKTPAAIISHVFGRYAETPRWVAWRWGRDPHKPNKVRKPPIDPKPALGGGHFDAAVSDPKTWGTLAQARAASPLARVGICLNGDDLAVWDGDGCLNAGNVASLIDDAHHVIFDLLRSYAEVSPSEVGVKVFFLLPEGTPEDERRYCSRAMLGPTVETDRNNFGIVLKKKPKAELFAQRLGVYLTVTGQHLPGTPLEVRRLSREEWRALLEWMRAQEDKDEEPAATTDKVDVAELRKALGYIDAAEDYDTWIKTVGFGLQGGVLRGQLTEDDALVLYHEWASRAADEYDEAETNAKWRTFREKGGKLRGLRTIWKAAEAKGYSRPRKTRGGKPDKESTARVLIGFLDEVELWHDEDKQAYATFMINDHKENHRVDGEAFQLWLMKRHYDKTGNPVYPEALRIATGHARSRAMFDGKRHRAWLRTARGSNGCIYVDLGDETWRAVEVTPDGWGIVAEPPVRFRRSNNMGALPEPNRGGNWRDFLPFTNFANETDSCLDLATSVAYLVPDIPYPITTYMGGPGTAKSTTLDIKTSLTDPQRVSRPGPPKEEEDLVVTAKNRHVVAYDNLGHIDDPLADAFCRLATGGGIEKRARYHDDKQNSISVKRPLALTSIKSNLNRADLIERMVIINLVPIDEERRVDEEELWQRFNEVRPKLLGVVLDGLASGLRHRADTKQRLKGRLPRMADFVTWAEAAMLAYGIEPDTFLAAYNEMAGDRFEDVAQEDPVASLLADWLFEQPDGLFEGGSKELHGKLYPLARDRGLRSFPNNPAWLGRHLAGLKKLLGVLDVTYTRYGANNRNHRLQHRLRDQGSVEESAEAAERAAEQEDLGL